ncbi:MAG: VanZ family protein [Lachnospiraceae bacterium]|nr:VanZ family protein [Lachnospiraceae bacterium]
MVGIEHLPLQYYFFDTYIGYFLEALPIALVVSVIYGVVRYRKDTQTGLVQKIFSCVFVCYMTGLVCLVVGLDLMRIFWYWVIYHRDSGIMIQFFSGEYDLIPDLSSHISGEAVGNFLMFLPFGILYPLSRKETSWKRTVLVGFVTVLVIEILQPIFGSAFDANDVILDTLGIVVSASLFMAVRKALHH